MLLGGVVRVGPGTSRRVRTLVCFSERGHDLGLRGVSTGSDPPCRVRFGGPSPPVSGSPSTLCPTSTSVEDSVVPHGSDLIRS